MSMLGQDTRNAMTVDVEDYFQVTALEPNYHRDMWDKIPLRVERNCERIFQMFDRQRVKATFFMLAWVAQRCPNIVRQIVAEGHELASHGYAHRRAFTQSEHEFADDVCRSKAILEDIGGVEVAGYRAPSYSIGEQNFWALRVLQEAGYRYSSSIYPIVHDLYGMPQAPRFAFYPLQQAKLLEIPVSTFNLMGRNFPCGGGGYFRLLPYALSKWAISRVNRKDKQSLVFYFHPWEIDPGQPKPSPISLKTRIRHYVNLSRMEAKLEQLLRDFSWGRVDQVVLKQHHRAPVWAPTGMQPI